MDSFASWIDKMPTRGRGHGHGCGGRMGTFWDPHPEFSKESHHKEEQH